MKTSFWNTFVLIGGSWLGITVLNIAILPTAYAPHAQVETVKEAPLSLVVRAPASLEPKDSITFKADFDGAVLTKHYEEGKPVTNGQLLIEISREKIQLDYEGKSDALKNARADLIKAQKDEKLQKILYKRQAVAYSTVEDAERTTVHAAQALRSAQETFKLEEELWNKNKLYAPFSGTVIKDYIGSEGTVASGKEILTLADLSGYSVRARVDELEIAQVHEGQDAEVHIEAFSTSSIPATVSVIGSQADENGSTEIPITLVLKDSHGLPLRPKLTAEVRIISGQTNPTLSVPLTALVNQDGQNRVWVVSDSHRLELRTVEVGKSNPDRVEITQGLKAGERVCITADSHFSEGMKVKVD